MGKKKGKSKATPSTTQAAASTSVIKKEVEGEREGEGEEVREIEEARDETQDSTALVASEVKQEEEVKKEEEKEEEKKENPEEEEAKKIQEAREKGEEEDEEESRKKDPASPDQPEETPRKEEEEQEQEQEEQKEEEEQREQREQREQGNPSERDLEPKKEDLKSESAHLSPPVKTPSSAAVKNPGDEIVEEDDPATWADDEPGKATLFETLDLGKKPIFGDLEADFPAVSVTEDLYGNTDDLYGNADDSHGNAEGEKEEWTDEEGEEKDILYGDLEGEELDRQREREKLEFEKIFEDEEKEDQGKEEDKGKEEDQGKKEEEKKETEVSEPPAKLIRLPSLSIFRGDEIREISRGKTFEDDESEEKGEENEVEERRNPPEHLENTIALSIQRQMAREHQALVWRQESSEGETKFFLALASASSVIAYEEDVEAPEEKQVEEHVDLKPAEDQSETISEKEDKGESGEDEEEEEEEEEEKEAVLIRESDADEDEESDHEENKVYVKRLVSHLAILERTIIAMTKEVDMMRLEYEGLKVRNIRLVDEVAHFPVELGEVKAELLVATERLEIKDVELSSLKESIQILTQKIFALEKEAKETEALVTKEKEALKSKLAAEVDVRTQKEFKVKQLENKVAQLEKQVISDKELKDMLKTESPVKAPQKGVAEAELIKRLEKKVKKLELESFEHDMQVSQIEARHNESLRKIAVRAKMLENSALHLEYKKIEDENRIKELELETLRRQLADMEEYQVQKNIEMKTEMENHPSILGRGLNWIMQNHHPIFDWNQLAKGVHQKHEENLGVLQDKIKKMEQEVFETELKVAEVESKKKQQLKLLNARIRELQKSPGKKSTKAPVPPSPMSNDLFDDEENATEASSSTQEDQGLFPEVNRKLFPKQPSPSKGNSAPQPSTSEEKGKKTKAKKAPFLKDIFAEEDPELIAEREKVKSLEEEVKRLRDELANNRVRSKPSTPKRTPEKGRFSEGEEEIAQENGDHDENEDDQLEHQEDGEGEAEGEEEDQVPKAESRKDKTPERPAPPPPVPPMTPKLLHFSLDQMGTPGQIAPPPGLSPSKSPLKSLIVPGVKMKPLHWSKIPQFQLANTLWDKKIDDDGIRSTMNVKEIEELFCQKSIGIKRTASSISGDEPAKKEAKVEVSLLDGKRSHNIAILISRVKMSFQEIREALLKLDEDKLTEQMIVQFLETVPSPEELALLSDFPEEEKVKLGVAEQFLAEMIKIDRYGPRLECFLFKRKFDERVADLEPNSKLLIESCQVLRASSSFEQILSVILAIGNYMNGATFRGGAFGFKLDALSNLSSTRSTNNRTSLLHFFAKSLDAHYPETFEAFETLLPVVSEARKIDLKSLEVEMTELQNGLNFIRAELPFHEGADSEQDHFYAIISEFLENSSLKVQSLQLEWTYAKEELSRIMKYFAEDEKTSTPESFFGQIADFLLSLQKVLKETRTEGGSQQQSAKANSFKLQGHLLEELQSQFK